MRHRQRGMSHVASCRSTADVWSLGNLLALLALGYMPFPGHLDLVPDSTLLQQEEADELLGSVIRQVVDPVRVRFV